ncbi:MAG TPA: MFS transporter [Caldilineae bacterium]|nr:MFS transporter [Caldilineae bacterium]
MTSTSAGRVAHHAGLPLKTKVLYGLGEASNAIKAFTFGLFLLFFYTTVLGLPGTWVGIATSIGLIWDAVIDPFIGHLSDRIHPRLGRRHALMLVGAIGMGVAFFAIFRPPRGLSSTALFAWLVATSLLLRTTNSIFMVPYHALGAELSRDYHERTAVTSARAAFALVGTLVAAGLSFSVFFPDRTPSVDPKLDPSGYATMGLAFGLAMTALGLVATLGTLSHRASEEPEPRARQEERLGFVRGLLICLHNPAFLLLTLSASLFFLASVINATVAIHYLVYYAGITKSNALSLFQLSFYVGALAGVALWLRVARRWEKQHLYFVATLAVAALMVAAYRLVGEGRLFGTGNLSALLIGHGTAGLFASALWVLPPSMIADVTDWDALITGQRREGVFFGIYSFSQQVAASLAILITGVLVDRFAGLVPGQATQSPLTIERLAMLFSLLPAMIVLVAALLILGYRLTRGRLQQIQAELGGWV